MEERPEVHSLPPFPTFLSSPASASEGGETRLRRKSGMVVSLLREMKDRAAPAHHKGHVIQDLEFAIRAKGGLSREEEIKLQALAAVILKSEDELMKMELANMYGFVNKILTKHSDDERLVQAVKRHFFAEHLFDDLHQDKPLFRWHPRHSYVDSAFVERVKEIEASNPFDEATSISRQTTLSRSFGDLTEDPFACILGSPGSGMESNISPEKTGTVLKRSELRARRRSHRHHHDRHADKLNCIVKKAR
ncbi:hypothetical protein PR202_ga00307 [Eleusine coracana subsp. coracana]|uniref:Uncharacterized protein n=1 Tax=Eleusine coracana subsp. coracana TaxID=191504 RepID=A0AAV5BG65_ELECO|nr:hypothetical protein PR202_ga00307 [Eleusine coracana subsp. coracana]